MKYYLNQIKSFRDILPVLMVLITGQSRYIPEIKWSDESWTHNVFRAYELMFGRRGNLETGEDVIRCEWSLSMDRKTLKIYTFEATFAHIEGLIRRLLKFEKLVPFKVVSPQLAMSNGMVSPYSNPFLFAIAYNEDIGAAGGNSTAPAITAVDVSGTDGCILNALEFENIVTLTALVFDDGAGGGSQAFTIIGSALDVEAGNFRNYFHHLVNPTSGSGRRILGTVGTGPWRIGASYYTGVDQTTATTDHQQNTDASTPAAQLNTSNANGSWQIGHANCPYGSLAISSGAVNRTQVSTAAGVGYIEDSDATVASGNTNTINWTFSTKMGWITAMLRPTPASGPANLKTYNTNVAANIKSIDTNLIANVKSLNTNT